MKIKTGIKAGGNSVEAPYGPYGDAPGEKQGPGPGPGTE